MMEDKLGCSFDFLFVRNKSSMKDKAKGCTLDDIKGKEAFQDIVYGNSLFQCN